MAEATQGLSMADKYPKYYKRTPNGATVRLNGQPLDEILGKGAS